MTYCVVGDVHGCFAELIKLLNRAGWDISIMVHTRESYNYTYFQYTLAENYFIAVDGVTYMVKRPKDHPEEKIVFLGDLIDRGPGSIETLEFVMELCELGLAELVLSNHDSKLYRHMLGNPVRISHGLEKTLEELEYRGEYFKRRVKEFLSKVEHKFVAPDESFIGVHAAYLPKDNPKREQDICLYGWVNRNRKDENDIPIQINWFDKYEGTIPVLFGHIVHFEPTRYKTINSWAMALDTGGCFGGQLTAMRMPSEEIFQVDCPVYYQRTRPYNGPVYLSEEEAFAKD